MNWYLVFGLLLLSSSCKMTSRARKIEADLRISATQSYQSKKCCAGQDLAISYIGCGGFYFRLGNNGIFIDPYFSNADVLRHPFRPLVSDTLLIDSFFKNHLGNIADTAEIIKTILISHTHHDHLGDLPSILRRNLPHSKLQILGTQGVRQIIAANDLIDDRLTFVNLDSSILSSKLNTCTTTFGEQKLKVTAIVSAHAPHILGMKAPGLGGKIKASKPAKSFFGYKEGTSYNFIIDFLDATGKITYRIFSHAGAAADAPIGFPTAELLREHPVDLLLLCSANYDQAKAYPDDLITLLRPSHIVLAHWEDFFTPMPQLRKHPKVVPMTNVPSFVKLVKKLMQTNQIQGAPIILHPLSTIHMKL
jgi:Beta-lactamase superfamily domain